MQLAPETIAAQIVSNTRYLEKHQEKDKELKALMRKFEGQKYTTNDGSTVSVSRTTEDRQDGTRIVFDEARYVALDPDSRALLERLGVVTMQPKIVKGQAPRVTVKLS